MDKADSLGENIDKTSAEEFIDISTEKFLHRVSKVLSNYFYIPADEIREVIEIIITHWEDDWEDKLNVS